MKVQMEANIEHFSSETSTSNGLVIQIFKNQDPQTHASKFNGRIFFPRHWQTTTTVTSDDNRLHLIAIGHLYARTCNSFDVSKSLRILGQIYRKNGIDAICNEIGGGMFALFVVDYENQLIHATCDLLACMPLFFQVTSNTVTLATSQHDLKGNQKLLRESCIEYIRYGYLPYSPSLFEGVNRLGPGQVITVSLASAKIVALTEEKLPEYPLPSERIVDPYEACQKLDYAFTKFYSRLATEKLAMGLSGGYDSRLIAAYTKDKKPYLVTFNYPGTKEVETAQYVAKLLGNKTHIVDIPADAPKRFVDDFYFGMQTLDSMESSHVFALLDSLSKGNPSYILDGFFGDANLGGYYYYKLYGGIEPLVKVISLRDKYDQEVCSIDEYISILNGGVGRTIDFKSGENINKDILKSIILKQLKCCHTHADMIELLKYRFRGRCMIACGPISFLRRIYTLCPYYDTDVLKTCISIDKQLRAGERLYNAFWRYRFPELANIPKESTGGRAIQNDLSYRMTHFGNALINRIQMYLPGVILKNKSGGDIDDFAGRYQTCFSNRDLFDRAIECAKPRLKDIGLEAILTSLNKPGSSKQLYLRTASLAILLGEIGNSI